LQVPPDEFDLPFFKEEEFIRKYCSICKNYYWTQNQDSENCGDSPCIDYDFIGNSPVRKPYDLPQMREKFLSFFEERGHGRINPYPVVARWRNDLMVTIASIIDFQPYVTEGLIQPPANPLVISQPCIRFEDIDLVGYTAGRHLTFFEMGGHHAFNYQDKPQVYWKDKTVRYHHELLTEDLGVPSNIVTYKEGLWSGGGNAGFDLEGCVGGLEVSTLVFMMYKVVGDKFEPMPIKVVDTGYGIERWSWLSQGSESAFHAIYGSLVDEILDWSGVEIEKSLLGDVARLSCINNAENILEERKRIATMLDLDPAYLDQLITPVESTYAILDHTKSLVFILSEGVVPSNVREGYLARLLFRRGNRLLRRIGIEDKFNQIIEAQIELWGKDFPQIVSMRDEILEMILHEKEKYGNTLKRGRNIVLNYLKKEGKSIPVNQLVQFYDSHGLTPEDVNDAATTIGIKIEAPKNFYSLVALSHMGEESKNETFEEEISATLCRFPKTKKIFHEDSYLRRFDAEVFSFIKNKYLVLDKTAFYAEGGGQISDIGIILKGSKSFQVIDAKSIEGIILHEVKNGDFKKGDKIKGEIDWGRRIALMRSHTATHILLGSARRVLGEHAWQSGASKGVERSRIDVSHYKRISRNEIEKIENIANEIVRQGRKVECSWLQRDEAEKRYGFRLYQGGAVPGEKIRIVEIEGGWETEACGGTHLKNTAETGLIKIVNTERVQDGVERLVFAVGPHAINEIQSNERTLLDLVELFESPIEKIIESASNVIENNKKMKHKLAILQRSEAKEKAEKLLNNAIKIKDVKLIINSEEVQTDFLIEVCNALTEIEEGAVAIMLSEKEGRMVVKAGERAISRGIHAGKLTSLISKEVGAKGGGRPHFGQGGKVTPEKFETTRKFMIKKIKELYDKKFP
jgi:alanyl-tRNA synthetase